MRPFKKLALAVLMASLVMSAPVLSSPVTAYQAANHQDLTEYAITILSHDGRDYMADVLEATDASGVSLKEWLLEGTYDCDRLDLARNHYYNPLTGTGLTEYTSYELCQDMYDAAVEYWEDGDYTKSMYYLGRALHMVQDSTVPHHGHNDPLNGHVEFESYMDAHIQDFVVGSGGIYNYSGNASGFVHNNAVAVYDHYYLLTSENASTVNYLYVGAIVESLALRSSAGFLSMFFTDVRRTAPQLEGYEVDDDMVHLIWQPAVESNFLRYEVYASSAGKDIELDPAHLVKTVMDREDNTLTIKELKKNGEYEFQVVTVLTDDSLESSIVTIEIGASKLLFIGIVAGLIAVTVIFFTLGQTKAKKKRRRR